MSSAFREALSFPYLVFQYQKNFKHQKAFMANTIERELQKAIETNDGSLSEKDILKIRTYYGNSVPSILGEGFAILRQKPMSLIEREILTYLGGLTGLFDDLFDEKKIERNRLLEMINKPDLSQGQTTFERLYLKFYQRALSLGNSSEIKRFLNKGFYAQLDSLEQTQADITQDRIAEITRTKGGVFLQFYRTAFSPLPSKEESEMLFNIGALGQLENDIFDVYKDYQDQIKTLATTCNSIQELSNTYQRWIEQYETSLRKLQYSENAKSNFEQFTRILYLRGIVCLRQYQSLENKMGKPFKLSNVARQDLICDMGKLSNQFRLALMFVGK